MALNINESSENRKRKEEAFKQSQQSKHTPNHDNTIIPKKKPVEKKKKYTFSIRPSVRSNIEKIAKENNYKSASDLLDTMFENM
ncbi:hypothetical protein [Staphylococcus warneri]|uniref:hypothetical protein n=1 Tax=Staphylococcus warneri TaxID=1292 RepID=UPI001A9014DC|nr:hypothetical protein [Staphylococcus warneri]MBO0377079.1 hypothetical protein [Staphylococcus warneri]